MSSHNPFRTGRSPAPSPSSTPQPESAGPSVPPKDGFGSSISPSQAAGSSGSAMNGTSQSTGALNGKAPSSSASTSTPTMTGNAESSNNSGGPSSSGPSTDASRRTDPMGITEDEPPAYTPGPDVYHGESTVEYGPARPFQQAPRPARPPQHHLTPQPTGWSAVQNHVVRPAQPPSLLQQITGTLVDRLNGLSTGGNSYNNTSYPNGPHTHNTGPWPGNSYPNQGPRPNPPPIQTHQTGPQPPPLPPRQHPPSSATSEFARDFYAAGAGPQSSSQDTAAPSPSPASYAPPPHPPPGQQYAPPSHPPPSSQHAPPPGPPPGTGSSSARPPENDGKPTTKPTPGHPLLRDGKLLVYPSGFTCEKCHNIGYKHADPSHPCKKCWHKYSKPYTGAITYSDFTSNAGAGSGKTFQKPLPVLRPPQHSHSQAIHNNHNHNSNNNNGGWSGYPGANAHYNRPVAPPLPPRPGFAPMGYGPAPPGAATLVRPGDPRIGGRLCWRCGGDGLVNVFLWEEQCPACGGTGRVFP
ncbi:hypothetical protein VNI00_010523 [Paramarasmius palmivorus]|uniref:Uncharacterized protein n=1 Tax=Paramarasmius palmivorus TaxID=297713 RepID=A0AAW0CJF7_9AGAR